jgi:hypothetical protein
MCYVAIVCDILRDVRHSRKKDRSCPHNFAGIMGVYMQKIFDGEYYATSKSQLTEVVCDVQEWLREKDP